MIVSVRFYHDKRRAKKSGKFPLKICITDEKNNKSYLSTKMDLSKEEYDKVFSPKARGKDLKIQQDVNGQLQEVKEAIGRMEIFSLALLKEELKKYKTKVVGVNETSLLSWMAKITDEKRASNNAGSADQFKTARNSLKEYAFSVLGKKDLDFHDIDVAFLNAYEKWMVGRGRKINTVGNYLRAAQTTFNKAKAAGKIPEAINPFGRYKYIIPSEEGTKIPLKEEHLNILIDSEKAENIHGRRMLSFWKFLFFTGGMNLKDMACLRWDNIDLDGNMLIYYRRKTKESRKHDKRPIRIPLLQEALAVIDEFANENKGPKTLLFNISNDEQLKNDVSFMHATRKFIAKMNKAVRIIAKREKGIPKTVVPNITSGVARHTFANLLLSRGYSPETIRQLMGHRNISTTYRYLSGLPASQLNDAMKSLSIKINKQSQE